MPEMEIEKKKSGSDLAVWLLCDPIWKCVDRKLLREYVKIGTRDEREELGKPSGMLIDHSVCAVSYHKVSYD